MANIIRVKKNKNYSTISNVCIRDRRLSAKAKGIHTYLLALPDDWKIYISELKNHFSDGISAITSGVNELIKYGYIERLKLQDGKGRYAGYDYTVYEHPKSENPITGNLNLLNTNNTKGLTAVSIEDHEDLSSTSPNLPLREKTDNTSEKINEVVSLSGRFSDKQNALEITDPARTSVNEEDWVDDFSHSCDIAVELNRSASKWKAFQELNKSQR